MGLLDDLQRTVDHVGNAVGHAVGSAAGTVYSTVTGDQAGGQRIEHDIDGVSDAVFFDGTVQGTNPALIHKYFNNGPGTKSWGVAEATNASLKSDYDDYGTRVNQALSTMEQGWSGQAAQQGLQSVQQSQTIAQSMSQHMAAKQTAYGNQIGVFDSTKQAVVAMPDNPPPATNPMAMDVVSTASGAVTAAAYQEGTKANQQAYSSYQPPTQSHASAIPKGDSVTPGQSNPTPGPTPPGGPGISEPRSYSPGFGTSQDHHTTTSQPGSGIQQHTPPTVGNSGQPGGSPVTQPPVVPGSGTTSTGVAGYTGTPSGNPNAPVTGGYDSSFGPRGSSDSGFGSGSVFAGGGFGGGFGGGAGSGYGSGAGATGGRAGSPGAGNAAGASAAEEAMAGRAGAAGARGAAAQGGTGAAGAGGRGGKKEEDKEHKTAAYLVTEEHGSEVVGDLPPAMPPGGVIGG
ncbi:hypothetical protein [Kutzneria sp. 744]|uniref:hypothetical protein n=1 Tax=Kutzneria sp. (strain 744) TaxID=345341 RepID=UPI0003EED68F|nr:hypothetical protein [Kutzneria sp. 744]EWM15250.1 epstein-Barr nuclear antigen 1 [Kutzneria sp. 744]